MFSRSTMGANVRIYGSEKRITGLATAVLWFHDRDLCAEYAGKFGGTLVEEDFEREQDPVMFDELERIAALPPEEQRAEYWKDQGA